MEIMNNTDLQNAIQGALDNALRPFMAKLDELHTSQAKSAKTTEKAPNDNEVEEAKKHFASMKKRLIAKGIMPNIK